MCLCLTRKLATLFIMTMPQICWKLGLAEVHLGKK